jgi:hypothetical protein
VSLKTRCGLHWPRAQAFNAQQGWLASELELYSGSSERCNQALLDLQELRPDPSN